jgi:hypothetical protein
LAQALQRSRDRSEIILLILAEPAEPDKRLDCVVRHFDEEAHHRFQKHDVRRPCLGHQRKPILGCAQRARSRDKTVPKFAHRQHPGTDRLSYPPAPGRIKVSAASRPAEHLRLATVATGSELTFAPEANGGNAR